MSYGSIIKQTDTVTVRLNGYKYVIRLKNHSGFTITIDTNLNVTIGQSSGTKLTSQEWGLLNNEVLEGMSFMHKYATGNLEVKYKEKEKTIAPSKLKSNAFYADSNGSYVLYLGKCLFYPNRWHRNREGCNYIYIRFNGRIHSMSQDGSTLIVVVEGNYEVDSRSTKPRTFCYEDISFPEKIVNFRFLSLNGAILDEFSIIR